MIGFVPAAGTNERWSGGYKEMLPIGPHTWLLDNAISQLFDAGCDTVYVGSSPEKASIHLRHLERLSITNVSIILGGGSMWETMKRFLPYAVNDTTIMMMPDTVTDLSNIAGQKDMVFGVFETFQPERFSVFDGDRIVTKPQHAPLITYQAWGIASWSKLVTRHWLDRFPDTYDEAFNEAICEFGYSTFELPFYHDFANWAAYEKYIKEH